MLNETRKIKREVFNALYYDENREEILRDHKEYYRANRERILSYKKEHYKANKEAILKKSKEYFECNKEEVLSKNREYCRKNPDRFSLYHNHRRINETVNGGSHTIKQRREKFLALGNVCYYCSIPGKMTVDHMIPISRGGTDNIDNIVPACTTCNCRKGNKTLAEFFDLINTPKEIAINQARILEYKLTCQLYGVNS